MPILELPRTAGCLVCGRDNPNGLHLTLRVDDANDDISTSFTPAPEQIGFEGVIHGGVLATVLDELLAWAALWKTNTCCLCAELTIRYLKPAVVGKTLRGRSRVTVHRSRLITSTGELFDGDGLVASAIGKFVPLPTAQNEAFTKTVCVTEASAAAARKLGVIR